MINYAILAYLAFLPVVMLIVMTFRYVMKLRLRWQVRRDLRKLLSAEWELYPYKFKDLNAPYEALKASQPYKFRNLRVPSRFRADKGVEIPPNVRDTSHSGQDQPAGPGDV
jgi:hypothetical protein